MDHLYGTSIETRRKISYSEIQTYLQCQTMWYLRYVKKLRLDTVHTRFGSMAHKVLETRNIPLEELYPELKEEFQITNWTSYFSTILNELDSLMSDYEKVDSEVVVENEYLKGIIDTVWKNKTTGKYLLTDYKFTNTPKDQMDLLIDQQLYIYGSMFALEKGIRLDDVEVGYISIPKKELDNPRVLANGKLSKDKAQRTTYKMYLNKIHELNLDENDYVDILDALLGRPLIVLEISRISSRMLERIALNIERVWEEMDKGYCLEKCSSFDCKRCDLLKECKLKEDL